MSRPIPHRTRAAFTLMEVLLVLVILVVMGSIAVQMLGGSQRRANINTAQALVDTLSGECERYKLTMNAYPQDLGMLMNNPGSDQWDGPYVKDIPKDPWGNDYHYDPAGASYHQGREPDIWSDGPPGENKPIVNH